MGVPGIIKVCGRRIMNDNKAREYWDNQYWRYVIENNKFKKRRQKFGEGLF